LLLGKLTLKTCWVVLTQFWVNNGQTHSLGYIFIPKTVFWTNVGKIFLKDTSLDLSGTRFGYFS